MPKQYKDKQKQSKKLEQFREFQQRISVHFKNESFYIKLLPIPLM